MLIGVTGGESLKIKKKTILSSLLTALADDDITDTKSPQHVWKERKFRPNLTYAKGMLGYVGFASHNMNYRALG